MDSRLKLLERFRVQFSRRSFNLEMGRKAQGREVASIGRFGMSCDLHWFSDVDHATL